MTIGAQTTNQGSIQGEPPIFCGFSSGKGFFSAMLGGLIRVFTGGDVNHAFILYFAPEWNAWLTVGANANGVTIMDLPEFLKSRRIMHLFRPLGFSLWDGLRAHVADLDRSYDYTGLFGMAFVEISRKLHLRPFANLLDDHDDLFCSEWVVELVHAGLSALFAPTVPPPTALPFYQMTADQTDPATLCAGMAALPMLFAPVTLAGIGAK